MGRICIAVLGWQEDELTLGAVKALRSAQKIYLRTGRCGAADWLNSEGILFSTFDALYGETDDFDQLIELIVQRLAEQARSSDLLYGVNDSGDQTATRLLEMFPDQIDLVSGVSEGSALAAFVGGAFRQLNAIESETFEPDASVATLVREIDNPILAGEIKLKLMEAYPEEQEVIISTATGAIQKKRLFELDRLDQYGQNVCALIPAIADLTRLSRYSFADLCRITRRLRAMDGCPWDIEQTHESLRSSMVEEAYEVIDAIDRDDTEALFDELGDVLFQVAIHSEIGRQYGEFDMSDVTTAICQKMIRRHAHIFGEEHCQTSEDTIALWEQQKMKEKDVESKAQALRSITRGLPALLRAVKVQKKAQAFGATQHDDPRSALAEAACRLEENTGDEKAMGQMLLDAVRCAMLSGVDPELVLSAAIERYIESFDRMEREGKFD